MEKNLCLKTAALKPYRWTKLVPTVVNKYVTHSIKQKDNGH